MPRAVAALALAVAVAAVSTASVLAKLASVPGPVAAWWRLAVGVAVTALLALTLGGRGSGNPARLSPVYPLAAGVSLSLHFSLWLESLNHVTVAVSTAVVSTYPVFTLALESRRTRPPAARVAGALIAVAGVAVLARPWEAQTPHLYGVALALGGAVSGAIYFYAGRLARSQGYPIIPYTLRTYTVALAATTAYLALTGTNPLAVRPESALYLVLMGLIPMILGHTMANLALRYVSATTVTSLLLLEPFGASLLAYTVLGEVPHPVTVPAAAATVAGAMVVAATERSGRG